MTAACPPVAPPTVASNEIVLNAWIDTSAPHVITAPVPIEAMTLLFKIITRAFGLTAAVPPTAVIATPWIFWVDWAKTFNPVYVFPL